MVLGGQKKWSVWHFWPLALQPAPTGPPTLIADICIRGLWQPQTVALLDVHVVDTDAPSYMHRTTVAVLSNAEQEKKRKHNGAAEA